MEPSVPKKVWRGGVWIGTLAATWPLAKLSLSEDEIRIDVAFFGCYRYPRETIVSVERYGRIPFIANGIRIRHRIPNYEQKVVFWCVFLWPEKLLQAIAELGYPVVQ